MTGRVITGIKVDTTGTQDIDIGLIFDQAFFQQFGKWPEECLYPGQTINEEFFATHVDARLFDELLAVGWRHFGEYFYRYDVGTCFGETRRVLPLRVKIPDFSFSKSQRRNLRQNADLSVAAVPTVVTDEINDLFHRHSQRFKQGRPVDVYTFLSRQPDNVPVENLCVEARLDGRLVAASFLDLGVSSVSSIYGMFDPELSCRGLGTFTMLKEIEFARDTGRSYYYPGYAYHEPSFYDYKKRFRALEWFDWTAWRDLAAGKA